MESNATTPPAAQPPKPGQRRAELIRQRQAAEHCASCRGPRRAAAAGAGGDGSRDDVTWSFGSTRDFALIPPRRHRHASEAIAAPDDSVCDGRPEPARTVRVVADVSRPSRPGSLADFVEHPSQLGCAERVGRELLGGHVPLLWVEESVTIDELVQLKALTNIGPQSLASGNYYLLSDLLYRSAALTNTSGAVVEAYDADAYGNTLLFSGHGTDGLWFTNDDVQAAYSACRYAFTGREYDAESGYYFYRRRYLLPQLGRFGSRDPWGVPGGPAYQYAIGRPSAAVDPSGLKTLDQILSGVTPVTSYGFKGMFRFFETVDAPNNSVVTKVEYYPDIAQTCCKKIAMIQLIAFVSLWRDTGDRCCEGPATRPSADDGGGVFRG